MRVWCWPGNTNDADAAAAGARTTCRGWRLGRVITVVDRGFSSADNLAYLRRGGGHFIAGMRMRDGNPLTDTVLVPPGPLPAGPRQPAGQRGRTSTTPRCGTSICHNPEQAERDRTQREDAVTRLQTELDRIAKARAKTQNSKSRTRQTQGRGRAHEGRVRAARSPRPRPLAAPAGQRAPRDRPGQGHGRGQRLDGKYLIATSDPHISAEDAALGYKNLLEAERGFRDLKSNLAAAPRLPPARTPHPRPRPDLLAGAAARPRRRTPHRVDLAAHRHRTRPRPRRRPHRQRRHRRPHHPTHHHPGRHLPRLSDPRTTGHHRPGPELTRQNTPPQDPGTRRHTPLFLT